MGVKKGERDPMSSVAPPEPQNTYEAPVVNS